MSAGQHEAAPDAGSGPVGGRGLAVVGAGIAVLVFFILRPLLTSKVPVLPGTDASNLYAWELYTRSVFAVGRLPHWNPFLFGGTPHLADTQTMVFYPPAMLLRWIPPAEFFSWMVALHMLIAGIGTAFLARVIGLRWTAAAAAAIAVTLGGSVPGWIFNGHLILLFATAWLPWVLGLIIDSGRRRTVWPHPALVIVLILQFLSGYLQGTIYIAAASAACLLWLVVFPLDDRPGVAARLLPIAQVTLAGVLAAGLVAFQLLPTIQLVSEAGRTAGIPYSTAVRGGWSLHDIATFFFPFSGIPAASRLRVMADRTAYVGWVLTLATPLAFVGREHRRLAILFGGLAAGCIAFVLADALPFYQLHYRLFPGLRVPGRMLFVATLAVATLGAIGLDRLLLLAERWNRFAGRAVGTVLCALVVVDLLRFSSGAVLQTSPNPAPVLFSIPPGPGRSLSVCDRALGSMDLVIGARSAADGVGGLFLRDYSTFQGLALEDGPLRLRRDLLDLSNVTTLISCAPLDAPGLSDVGRADLGIVYHNDAAWPRALWTCGAEQVTHREAIDRLRQIRYDDQRRLGRRYFVNIRWAPAVDDAARGRLEARYHLAEGVRRDGNTWRYDLRDRSAVNVQQLLADAEVEDTHGVNRETAEVSSGEMGDEVLFGTVACSQQGTVTDVRADRPGGDVTVVSDAPGAGLVFMSEPYYSERMAFVDNSPVAAKKANVAFIAVPVPAGRHVVELRYVPRRFQEGLAISVVTLVAWVGAAGWLPRRRRSSSHSTKA